MAKGILNRILSALAFMLICITTSAQTTFGGVLKIDRTVQDWGDVTVKDGPLSCTFMVENVSGKDQIISSVVSSCGCTGVTWTKETLHPGDTGTINATYSNDEGAHSFDKTLSVYVDGIRKPLILHLRGVVHKKKLPLAETYPVHFGSLGLRRAEVKVGNMSQGEQKSTQMTLANISKKPLTVSFADMSDFLAITPESVTIPGQSTAEVVVTVTSDRSTWGKNIYSATPVVNGEKADGAVSFTATTKENFDSLTEAQKKSAPIAEYEGSVSPMPVAPGEKMEASFSIANHGRRQLEIYRIDYDQKQVEMIAPASNKASVAPAKALKLMFKVKTEDMKADSENLCVITLYTNDPEHSIINLYIDAIIL